MDKYLEERLNRIEKQLDQFKAVIEGLGKDVKRPIKAVRDGYYEAALTNAGSILENMLRDIWIREKISGNENRKTIEQLFSVVKNTIEIDRLVEDYIREIQLTRNRAAHGEVVTAEDTIETLRKLTAVLNWYFKRYGAVEKPAEVLDRKEGRTQEGTEGKVKGKRISQKRVWALLKKFKFKKLFPKPVKIVLVVMVLIYVVISLMSLINDWIYEGKIEQVRAEYNTYYNNLFPIKKTWLPEEWETRDCDAWDTYIKYFASKEDPNDYKTIIRKNSGEFYQRHYWDYVYYKTIDDLRDYIENIGKHYDFEGLFSAIVCNRISNPYYKLYVDKYPDLVLFLRHSHMLALKIRYDFICGEYVSGIEMVNKAMYVYLDLLVSSASGIEYLVFMDGFRVLCREMIPLLLSRNIDINHELFQDFEKVVNIFLEKLDDRTLLYRGYLKNLEINIFDEMNLKRKTYYLTGKIRFYNSGFSIKKYFFKKYFKSYQFLFERIKYIRDKRNRSIYISEYFEKEFPSSFGLGIGGVGLKMNIVKTMGKIVLIILTRRQHGPASREVLALQGTDIFMNEFSGSKFEILTKNENQFLSISKDLRLNLRGIDYITESKGILVDLYFKLLTIDLNDFKNLFNRFRLE